MANVKVTQDKNGVRWLELMRNGFGTLLEIRDNDEALQIISALQHSVHPTLLESPRSGSHSCTCALCKGSHTTFPQSG